MWILSPLQGHRGKQQRSQTQVPWRHFVARDLHRLQRQRYSPRSFWAGVLGTCHKWDPAPVPRSDSDGQHKKIPTSSSFSVSSGHDLSPTEVCGRFAAIPSKCRSVLLSLFPSCLCLAFLPSLCRGQHPWPQAGIHRPSRAITEVCPAAGNQPISNQPPPGLPLTSAGITGSRSTASNGKRPPAPELPGRSYLGNAAFATCAFKFILLLQSFH